MADSDFREMLSAARLYEAAQRFYSAVPRRFFASGRAFPAWHYIFEMTRRCNLRCRMCQYLDFLENTPAGAQKDGELTTEEWLRVISQCHRFCLVTFTGGEPLLRKDIGELLESASRRCRTHVITNATLLTEERAAQLAALAPRRTGGLGGFGRVQQQFRLALAIGEDAQRQIQKPGQLAGDLFGVGMGGGAAKHEARRIGQATDGRFAQFGQPVVQATRRFVGSNRQRGGKQYRPGIQSGFHLHDAHAAFGVTSQNGALDRRRAAPARQQRGVDVDAAESRQIKHRLRQNQALGRDDHGIGTHGLQPCLRGGIAQGRWLENLDTVFQRQRLDRRRAQGHSAP